MKIVNNTFHSIDSSEHSPMRRKSQEISLLSNEEVLEDVFAV